MGIRTGRRRGLAGAAVAGSLALAAGMLLTGPTGAAWADSSCTITGPAALQSAFDAGGTVVLCQDLTMPNSTLHVPAGTSVVLDLHGFDLTVTGSGWDAGIGAPVGAQLTITDTTTTPGTLRATGGHAGNISGSGAGIGGGGGDLNGSTGGDSGTVTVEGAARVIATGGAPVLYGGSGAGIGGGGLAQRAGGGDANTTGGGAGPVTVQGTAVVTAEGGKTGMYGGSGAGIGGGGAGESFGSGGGSGISTGGGAGPVTVRGAATVAATSGPVGLYGGSGAGIGGGGGSGNESGYGPAGSTGGTSEAVTVQDAASVTSESAPAGTYGGSGAGVGGGGGGTAETGNGSAGSTGGNAGAVTVQDAATLAATSGPAGTFGGSGAGIGGGGTGMSVTAGSGNGDRTGGTAGTVTIQGTASVTANGGRPGTTAGSPGAGIGGGRGSADTGGTGHAGGAGGTGGTVTVHHGAAVTASAAGTSAIGGGSPAGGFGSLTNAGTLTLRSGNTINVPAGATVVNSGTIDNAGTLGGDGTWRNDGVIVNTGTISSPSHVTVHNTTVTLDGQGGTAPANPPTVYAASFQAGHVTLPAAATRPDHTFTGWYTAPAGGAPVTDTTDLGTGGPKTLTLYAQWASNTYTVTFNSGGGTATAPQTVDYNTPATMPTPPTRAGYTFNGWHTAASGGQAWAFTTPITGNTTVYAQWTIDTYTVTFNTSGGTATAPQTVDYNTPATMPAPPTRVGYTFNGWHTAETGGSPWEFTTPVTGDTTLYAQWTAVPATPAGAAPHGPSAPAPAVGPAVNTGGSSPTTGGPFESPWLWAMLLAAGAGLSAAGTLAHRRRQ